MHLISSDMMLRKHGLDHPPWEGTDNSTGSNSNKKARLTTTDGAIRPEEHNAIARANPDSRVQPPSKTTGMDDNNNDAEDNTGNILSSSSSSTSKLNDVQPVQQSRYRKEVIIQRMDNLQEDECHKHSEPNKSKQEKNFFSRVDELKAYKDEHGHLNMRQKENQSLYGPS